MNEQFTGQTNSTVSVTDKDKVTTFEHTEDNVLPIEIDLQPTEHVARVRVSGGITKNLGNFESLRIDVSIELPAKNKKQNIEDVFNYNQRFVAAKIDYLKRMAFANLGIR